MFASIRIKPRIAILESFRSYRELSDSNTAAFSGFSLLSHPTRGDARLGRRVMTEQRFCNQRKLFDWMSRLRARRGVSLLPARLQMEAISVPNAVSYQDRRVGSGLGPRDENIWSILAFTSASILMIGGHGRLKPSPGSLRVASNPSLVPRPISGVA